MRLAPKVDLLERDLAAQGSLIRMGVQRSAAVSLSESSVCIAQAALNQLEARLGQLQRGGGATAAATAEPALRATAAVQGSLLKLLLLHCAEGQQAETVMCNSLRLAAKVALELLLNSRSLRPGVPRSTAS